MPKTYVEITTDGACSPNPGRGGWGAVLVSPAHDRHTREISGAVPESTNNRMEMTAAIEGLRALKRPCRVLIRTDSKYLLNGFTKGWVAGWKRRGWQTADKKPVKNQDLWVELDRLCGVHEVEWTWVEGHSGDPLNERADALAVAARESLVDER